MTTSISKLDAAFEYLVSNKSVPSKALDRRNLKDAVDVFIEASMKGISHNLIKKVAVTLIFTENYDITLRRRLLYAMIPVSKAFPYEILPLAVSTAASTPISPLFQSAILQWLAALLEYQIIDPSNKFLHICYTSLFNLMSQLRNCGVVSKILYRITKREDVVSFRIRILMSLINKSQFPGYVQGLLSLYSIYRPDLVIKSRVGVKFPAVPYHLRKVLMEARLRQQESSEDIFYSFDELWPDINQTSKANPHHEPYAFPRPEVLTYADTLEEKKSKKLYVLQYKSIDDMIANVSHWRHWVWPNSSPCLLRKPLALTLFRGHDIFVKTSVTNWLELALRTEIILGLGNLPKKRQETLLEASISLVKHSEMLIPAVYNFVAEFLGEWDRFSHMDKILELLSCVPFTSPIFFFETVFANVSGILCRASTSLWCSIVNALTNMAVVWALQAHSEEEELLRGQQSSPWPFELEGINPLEGIYFLTESLNRFFISAATTFHPHPLIICACINYYNKINVACEELRLPIFVAIPPEVTLAVVSNGDVLATHRLGHLLAKYRSHVERVKKCKATPEWRIVRRLSLLQVESINLSVHFFLDSVVSLLAFSDHWKDSLSPYFKGDFLEKFMKKEHVSKHASLIQALPYLPVVVDVWATMDDTSFKKQKSGTMNNVMQTISSEGLTGIQACANSYKLSK